jgi:outer membrane protein OmpA-like peptidoglycan-associated protein
VNLSGALTIIAAGTCSIDANDAGAPGYSPAPQISQSFAVTGPTQNIVFTSAMPAAPKVGETYTPVATGGGSGNPVVFSLNTTSSGCTYNAVTGLVTFTSTTSRCVIDANQAGNATYSAASQVSLKIPAMAAATVSLTVYFANNSWLIRSSYRGRLTSLARAIKTDHLTTITVTGYASSTGAHAHNTLLGAERAKVTTVTLTSLLVKLNMAQVHIASIGEGASHFVAFPTTNASNRRTTITAT